VPPPAAATTTIRLPHVGDATAAQDAYSFAYDQRMQNKKKNAGSGIW